MIKINDIPAWLYAQAGPPSPRKEKSDAPLVDEDDPGAITRATAWLRDSAPDHGTYNVACRVKDFGISEAMCGGLMLEHWRDARGLGKADEHVLFRVANAYRYGTSPVGVASPEAEFEDVSVEVVDRRRITAALPVRNVLSEGVSRYQNYLVKGLLNFGMVGLCAGAKNAGKSPLLLDIAAHIVKGEEWLGHRVRQAYVLYVATEGWTGIGNRLAAVRQEYFGGAEVAALDYLATSLNLRTSPKDARSLIQTASERATYFGLPPGLIIIDTLSHTLAGGDDSSQEHTKPVVANAKIIAAETGAAVLFAHHPTKNGSSGVRGSSTLEDDTDLTIKVEQDPKSTRRWVSTPRVKDYAEIKPVAFEIKKVPLGHDQDGDEITSVVVSWRPDAADEFDDKITGNAQRVLDALDEHLRNKNATSATYSEWFAAFRVSQLGALGHAPKDNTMASNFKRGLKELCTQGCVEKTEEDQYVKAR